MNTEESRSYVSQHGYSEFMPTARIGGGDIWASPDGDIDIVLSAEQWIEWMALIQKRIDELAVKSATDPT